MTQRIDVIVDGKTINTNQRSDNDYLWRRIRKAAQTARRVELVRHVPKPAPLPPAPTPVPLPATPLQQAATNVIFCAQEPLAALQAPAKFKVALTADPAYAEWATPEVVAQFRAQGRKVLAWGVQTQIPVADIFAVANRLALDGVILQGETSDEYRTAIEAGATIIVGNPNAWTAEQRTDATDRILHGVLAVIAECYTNVAGPWPDAYSSQGVPVASLCLGMYDGSGEQPGGRYISPAEYKQHTPPGVWPSVGLYHAAAVHPEDWQALSG